MHERTSHPRECPEIKRRKSMLLPFKRHRYGGRTSA
jgi:hypothetical protein